MALMDLITAAVGLAWPSYASFKAIESGGTEDDTQWLTYWVVYSFVHFIEFFFLFILEWVPLYSTIKLLFITWMVLPQFNGATYIYRTQIRRFFMENQKDVDASIANLQGEISKNVSVENVVKIQHLVEEKGLKQMVTALNNVAAVSTEEVEVPPSGPHDE
eukprot:TRINITY_DN1640_c0_g1_i1.p2 TRINITY_DN1640_c0_g1~~TRINITY_DN1640_c0_g1_i1.p2  ORF type:complete len:161 (-),score=46.35 TRINITY_DN1640_c0_g1_i1:670-1152(-)